MTSLRRRTVPELAGIRRETLTNAFLALYAGNQKFVYKLRQLVQAHAPALSVCTEMSRSSGVLFGWYELEVEALYGEHECMKALASAISDLVNTWGLHALPGTIGCQAVTTALLSIWRNPNGPVWLLWVNAHFIPHVDGEDISAEGWPRPLTFSFDGRWHPDRETPGDATKRLEAEFAAFIRAEIQAGVLRLEEAGYEYDDSTSTPTYLEWLFRRVALREPVADIKASMNGGATYTTIETMTKRLARSLGIKRIPDARDSQRGKR